MYLVLFVVKLVGSNEIISKSQTLLSYYEVSHLPFLDIDYFLGDFLSFDAVCIS